VGSFRSAKKQTRGQKLTAVTCGAPKASENGYGVCFGDAAGDCAGPRVSFSFGGSLAAYGAVYEPLERRERIDRHDSLRDETRWEEDHRVEGERPHVPELARATPLTRRASSPE
jgi:hypothetical protein